MKKIIIASFLIALVAMAGSVRAATEAEKAEEELQKRLKLIADKQAELNGNAWNIEIKAYAEKGKLAGVDELFFQNNKFRSEKTGKMGFNSTNYTITPNEKGASVFETMQTGKEGEVIFWRGEWLEDNMTGVISRQLEKGNEEYFFNSTNKRKVPKSTDEDSENAQLSEEATGEAGQASLSSTPAPSKTSTPEKKSEPKKKSSFFF